MNRGRLLQLKFRRSREARQEALATIRPAGGGFVARIGGRVRGAVSWFRTRREAEAAVHAHYTAAMLAFIRRTVRP